MLDPMATRAEMPSFTGIQRQVDALPRGEDLFDRAVSDRVHAHLESRVVGRVEELRHRVVVVVQLARVRAVVVGVGQCRGSGADRAVDREVPADRGEPPFHRLGERHRREDRCDVDRQPGTMSEEHLEVRGVQGHLVHRRHAP